MSSEDASTYDDHFSDFMEDRLFYYNNHCPANCSPLYKAVFYGNLNLVHYLLDEHSAEEENYKRTLLHVAAAKGHDQIVSLFCQHDFPVNKKDNYFQTPLHLAVRYNHSKVFNLLLEKSNLNAENFRKETPLHLAVRGNHFQLSENLLQNGADVNVKNQNGQTPLHYALIKDFHFSVKDELERIPILKLLLKKGAEVNKKDKYNNTPLFLAVRLNHVQLVDFLLQNGAKVTTKDNVYKSALQEAIYNNNFELVKYLIENVFETSRMSDVISETQEQLPDPLESWDKPIDASECICLLFNGLLKISLDAGHLEIWKYLLKSSSKLHSNRYSQLHFAVQTGQVETVREILEASKVKTDSLASKLAVYIAVENENETILKILLEGGYSTEYCCKNPTPLHIASTFDHTRLVKILLEAGADINSETEFFFTPLDFASAAGSSAVVKFFLETGANIKFSYSSLKNVLKRGLDIAVHWVVTPFMFQNLLKITEMLLIAMGEKNDHFRDIDIFKYTMKIRVARENEQNNSLTSKKENGNKIKDNTSNGEFRPEILRCLLSYVKYHEIRFELYSILFQYLDVHPSVADIILEHDNETKCSVKNFFNVSNCDNYESYKNILFSVGHIASVGNLTNIPPCVLCNELIQEESFKLIVARLVLLPYDPDSEWQKFRFCDCYYLREYRYKCEQQIILMQKTVVVNDCKVTFYDILNQPVEKIASYLKNKHLLEILESSYLKFPIYARFLEVIVERGKRRKNLIDECENFMFNLIKINYNILFSSIDIHNIFRYLSVSDLWSLSAAFTYLLKEVK